MWTHVQSRPAAWAEERRYESEDDHVDVWVCADLSKRDGGGLGGLAVVDDDIVVGQRVEDIWITAIGR